MHPKAVAKVYNLLHLFIDIFLKKKTLIEVNEILPSKDEAVCDIIDFESSW